MAARGISLPLEGRPRRPKDPASWFTTRPDAGARAPALRDYLQALIDHVLMPPDDCCDRALLFKVFFSPDGLFRPVRAALKHQPSLSYLTQPFYRLLDDALQQCEGRPGGAAADGHFEAACGPRLRQEHVLYPKLDTWVQLAADRRAQPGIRAELDGSEEATRELAEQRDRREREREALELRVAESIAQRGEGTRLAREAERRLRVLRVWAEQLASVQEGATHLLFLPNGPRDGETDTLEASLSALEARHQAAQAQREAKLRFCPSAIERAADARTSMRGQLGPHRQDVSGAADNGAAASAADERSMRELR
eukprot:2896590-Prymnesium_polylepis.1